MCNNVTAVALVRSQEDNTMLVVTGSRDGTSLVWNMEADYEMPYYAVKYEGNYN
jgi:hypothetical protein